MWTQMPSRNNMVTSKTKDFFFFSHLSPNNKTTLSDISDLIGNSRSSFFDAYCSYLSLPHRINQRPFLRLKIHLQLTMLSIIPDDLCSQNILYSDLNMRCSLPRNDVLSFKESLSHMRIFCPEFWEQVAPSRANEHILTTSLFGRKFC